MAHGSWLMAHGEYCTNDKLTCIDETNEIYRCPDCGLYLASKNEFRSPDNPETEEEMMTSLEALRRENYADILHRILQVFGTSDIYGLDVGCARGWFLDEARKHNIKMDGIEPEENFYREAASYGVNVIRGLFPDDFSINREYDFIIFNDVFEHLPDLDSVMKKCEALLKPGGLLVINCPDSNGIFFSVAKIMKSLGIISYWRRLWQMDFYSPHLWYFDKGSLSKLMKYYNFSSIEIFPLNTITLKGLWKRINVQFKNSFAGYITCMMVIAASPFLKVFPKDIMCAFFRKS